MEHLTGARDRVGASGSDPFIPALVDVLPVPAMLVRLDDTIIGCNAEAAALLDLPAGRVGGNLRNLAIDRVAGLLSALTEIKDRLRPDDARQTGLRVDLGWAVVMLR